MKTTLNKIREHEPCANGWKKLLTYLGKTEADDEPLSLLTILDSNGLNDALWCLRAVEGYDKEIRLYAVWCARQVQDLMTDQRSLTVLDVAERYAHGQATGAELAIAWEAARATARAGAWDAASVVALAAAWKDAWKAVWFAASTAANADMNATALAPREDAWSQRRLDVLDAQEKEFRRLLEKNT